MSTSFKIPKRSRSDSDAVQMTSPLSRLQGPAAGQFKGFSPFGGRTLFGNSSTLNPPRWRPQRASDRLLSPLKQKNEECRDSHEDSPQRKNSSVSGSSAPVGSSGPSSLRPISVRSPDSLALLRAKLHPGSSPAGRKCPQMPKQDRTETQRSWCDLSDVREKQREKWRLFKEKKQNRTQATVLTNTQDQIATRTTASSEPIVLSSEEEEEEEEEGEEHNYVIHMPPVTPAQAPDRHISQLLAPPSFLQLDFCSFHMGLTSAQANGKLTISDSGITLPLRGAEGLQVELCVVASQIQAFGLWDGGMARGGTLFNASAQGPSDSAPSLLFLSMTDAQSKLMQTELRDIQPHTKPEPLCSLLLLVLKEQLSDLDSGLVLSVLDSGDYRKSRSGAISGPVDWNEGLVLVHTCPSPVTSHLLQLLGQKSAPHRSTRSGLRSGSQQLPTRLIQYPPAPSKGRISVSSEDLLCLRHEEFLNDVIIDFYLKYLLLEGIGGAVAERSHVFSSFFYKQLSKRRAAGEDAIVSITDRHTRHQRVKTWTRNVDIFNKDFLFIPVNQESHWFLVLVCFPGLEEPQHQQLMPSSETVRPASQTPPESTMRGCRKKSVLKRSCLLVMDSLKLSQHEAVTRLIRDYLSVEWEARRGSKRFFSADAFKTCNCRVPQQDNSSDCGLYLLQYAQAFLQNPVVDFEFPLRLETWFPRQQVRNKRDEIRNLVLRLHRDQGLNHL